MPSGCFNFSIPKLSALITFPPPYSLSILFGSITFYAAAIQKSWSCHRSHSSYIPYCRCHEILQFPHLNNSGIGSLLSVLVMLFGLTLILSCSRFLSHLHMSALNLLWLIFHPDTGVISSKLKFDCDPYWYITLQRSHNTYGVNYWTLQ